MSAQTGSKWFGGTTHLFNLLKEPLVAALTQRVVMFDSKPCVDAYVSAVTEVANADPELHRIKHVGTIEYYLDADQKAVLTGGGHRYHVTFCMAIVLRYLAMQVFTLYVAATGGKPSSTANRLLTLVHHLASCFVQVNDETGTSTMNYTSNIAGHQKFMAALVYFGIPSVAGLGDLPGGPRVYPHLAPGSDTHGLAFMAEYCDAFSGLFDDKRMASFVHPAMVGFRQYSIPVACMMGSRAVQDILAMARAPNPAWGAVCGAVQRLAEGCATAIKVETLEMHRSTIMDSNKALSSMTSMCHINSAVMSRLAWLPDFTELCTELNDYYDAMMSVLPFPMTLNGSPVDAAQVQIRYLHHSLFKNLMAKHMALNLEGCTSLETAKSSSAMTGTYVPSSDVACEFLALRYCSSGMAVESVMRGRLTESFAATHLADTAALADLNAALHDFRSGSYPTLVMPLLSMLEAFHFSVKGTQDRLVETYRCFAAAESWEYLQTMVEFAKHQDSRVFNDMVLGDDQGLAKARKMIDCLHSAYDSMLTVAGVPLYGTGLREVMVSTLVRVATEARPTTIFASRDRFMENIRGGKGAVPTRTRRVLPSELETMCTELASEVRLLMAADTLLALGVPRSKDGKAEAMRQAAQAANAKRPEEEQLEYPTWEKPTEPEKNALLDYLGEIVDLMPRGCWRGRGTPCRVTEYQFPSETLCMHIIKRGRNEVLQFMGIGVKPLTEGQYTNLAASLLATGVLGPKAATRPLQNFSLQAPGYLVVPGLGWPAALLRNNPQVEVCNDLVDGEMVPPPPIALRDYKVPFAAVANSVLLRTEMRSPEAIKEYAQIRALKREARDEPFRRHADRALSCLLWQVRNELKRLLESEYGQLYKPTAAEGAFAPPLPQTTRQRTLPPMTIDPLLAAQYATSTAPRPRLRGGALFKQMLDEKAAEKRARAALFAPPPVGCGVMPPSDDEFDLEEPAGGWPRLETGGYHGEEMYYEEEDDGYLEEDMADVPLQYSDPDGGYLPVPVDRTHIKKRHLDDEDDGESKKRARADDSSTRPKTTRAPKDPLRPKRRTSGGSRAGPSGTSKNKNRTKSRATVPGATEKTRAAKDADEDTSRRPKEKTRASQDSAKDADEDTSRRPKDADEDTSRRPKEAAVATDPDAAEKTRASKDTSRRSKEAAVATDPVAAVATDPDAAEKTGASKDTSRRSKEAAVATDPVAPEAADAGSKDTSESTPSRKRAHDQQEDAGLKKARGEADTVDWSILPSPEETDALLSMHLAQGATLLPDLPPLPPLSSLPPPIQGATLLDLPQSTSPPDPSASSLPPPIQDATLLDLPPLQASPTLPCGLPDSLPPLPSLADYHKIA